MKTPTAPIWKSTLCLLALALATTPALRAQTILTLPTTGTAGSGSTAVDFEFRLDGSIVEKGSGTSTLANSDIQSINRFLWYPAVAALRAGYGGSTETVSTIGQYSVALGYNTLASGSGSIALGSDANATNQGAVALGGGTASGSFSLSGIVGTASASGSISMGFFSTASGANAVALGIQSTSSGSSATAIGAATLATATYSTATGYNTTANSYNGLVLGTYNTGLSSTGATPSLTSWVATDPLLEVGNGTSSTAKADALIVYKNGNLTAQGVITAAPGGDIPMFTGY